MTTPGEFCECNRYCGKCAEKETDTEKRPDLVLPYITIKLRDNTLSYKCQNAQNALKVMTLLLTAP